MSFFDTYEHYVRAVEAQLKTDISESHIDRVLQKSRLDARDFMALLSPAAANRLEAMARKAHQLTVQHFGKTILLYTPLYLSNFCSNACVYCGFSITNRIPRKQLALDEVEKEAKAIANTGLKHILLLTGDAKKIASLDYLEDCVRILRRHFTSIGIEIYALETDEYAQLIETGVDSLTLYQETYNRALYDELHLKGPKKDFRFRLEAPERACLAGIRSANIGALLGLDDWRREAFFTGIHADYLQHRHPEADVGVSLPRIRPHAGEFQPRHIVTDRDMVQIMLAFRLFIPRAGIAISTRENAGFRDHLIQLGVTRMSAGSSTKVGGRTVGQEDTGQFDICDHRSVDEMKQQILALGYQPVFKDWQPMV